MATKTSFLSTINGFITALITQAKVRSAFSTVSDELYPTSVIDTNSTETYTTKAGFIITYSVRIIKTGNICRMKISITNTGVTGVLTPQNIFSWKDTEYRPKSGVNDIQFYAESTSGARVLCFINNSVLSFTNTAMPIGTFFTDYITYIAQD